MQQLMMMSACVFALMTVQSAFAVQDTVQKSPVTVTATRIPIETAQTGRSMFVLTRKDIAAMPVASVDEILRYVPGLETQQRGPMGTQADIILRGSTYSQVLVLIDGMRVNDPLTGHYNGYLPVSLAEIERIEILRGPSAALWGADAVGGVIHIITRTFVYRDLPDSNVTLHGEVGGGSNALVNMNAGGTAQTGGFLLSGGVAGVSSTGYPRVGEPPADFTLFTGSASMRHDLGEGRSIAVRAGGDSRDFDARYYYTRSAADQGRETVQTLWTQVMAQQVHERSALRLDVSYKRLRDAFNFNPTFPSINTHVTQYTNALLSGHFLATDDLSIGGGMQADYRAIQSTDRGDHETGHLAAFALATLNMEQLTVNGSARVDYDQNYQWQFTPQASAVYQLGILGVRGSIGRSVRAADYTERYVSTNIPPPLTPGRNLGNPDLEAESSWTWDLGADIVMGQALRASATYFSRVGTNLIDYVVTNSNDIPNNGGLVPDSSYFYAQNIASVRTSGVEAQFTGDVAVMPHVRISYVLGYTVLGITSDSGEVSKYISSTARQLGTVRLAIDIDRLNVGVQALYKVRDADQAAAINASLSESYFVANATARYRVTSGAGVYLQVNNVADIHYADILGAQMPGRWVMLGVFGTLPGN